MRRSRLPLAGVLALLAGVAWYFGAGQPAARDGRDVATHQTLERGGAVDAARAAFESRASGDVIVVSGTVDRTLADDRDGSPHQRFIVRTGTGLSVLVAHNIDLAPRLDGLAAGDRVAVLGQYEWNDKGGVLHWTHRDPAGRHTPGYIEWRGRRYQ